MSQLPNPIPPVPPVTAAGFADPVWPRWFRQLRGWVATAITNLSVAASNGFTGTVTRVSADSSLLTLGTSVSGMVKGSGGALTAAIPGTDYSPAPAFIALHSTSNQSAAALTPTAVTYSTLDTSRLFTASLPGSQIVAGADGTFNVQFSLQLYNSSASLDDVVVWVRKNGTDVPASASITSVAGKHGAIPGSAILALNIFLDLAVGDSLQLFWSTTLGTTSLQTVTPSGITAPVSPAVILTISQVYP